MSHCGNDCVGAAQRFTSADLVTADSGFAVNGVGRRPDTSSGVKPIGGISRVRKDAWIIEIDSEVTGNGFISVKKA
jgi:hypothetical protein